MNEKEVALFTRQLANMLQMGLPMGHALKTLRGGQTPSVAKLMREIERGVGNGRPLSDILRRHPRDFDPVCRHLMKAGEYSGALPEVLRRLADRLERTLAIKSRVVSALYYPAFVSCVALALIVITSFIKGKAPSPRTFACVSPFLFAWGVFSLWRGFPSFRDLAKRRLLDLPVLGDLAHKNASSRWSRTLANLYRAGVPLIEALELMSGTSGNPVYDEQSARVHAALLGGASLADAVMATHFFSREVVLTITTGEASGTLDSALERLADQLDTEFSHWLSGLLSLVPPLLMVALSFIVAFAVVPELLS